MCQVRNSDGPRARKRSLAEHNLLRAPRNGAERRTRNEVNTGQIATLEGAEVDKDKLAVLLGFLSNEPTEKSFKAFKAALLGEEEDEDDDEDEDDEDADDSDDNDEDHDEDSDDDSDNDNDDEDDGDDDSDDDDDDEEPA